MHKWDTFRVALHPDGLQCGTFYLGKLLKHLVDCWRFFYPSHAEQSLEIHKVFLRLCSFACDRIPRPQFNDLFPQACHMEVFL